MTGKTRYNAMPLLECKFYHSRIEVLQNESDLFVSVSLVRGKLRELRGLFYQKTGP
jgi:hypothetical protein